MIRYLRRREATRDWAGNPHGATVYAAIGRPTEDTVGHRFPTREAATIEVYHPKINAAFDSGGKRPSALWEDAEREAHSHNNAYQMRDDPDVLFRHEPGTIERAFAHPNMRPHIMTLLAAAHRDFGMLKPSNSLSIYSSRLAQRGMDMGLIVQNRANPSNRPTNGLNFDSAWASSVWTPSWDDENDKPTNARGMIGNDDWDWEDDKMPDLDVFAAKDHLRHLLRRNKPVEEESKPHGTPLPGMEWWR
jgi:hypothetical protein